MGKVTKHPECRGWRYMTDGGFFFVCLAGDIYLFSIEIGRVSFGIERKREDQTM